ncbi:MAG: class IV adenylate cyclase [Candidatus Verstraetearchaeota archaeon]|nr:class IV adenylate cyclase [Candidatus Verstraetearchaeota archaeon]
MVVEFEVKAPLRDADEFERRLIKVGGEFVREGRQLDHYLLHPCWDLRSRDEALRVRIEGDRCTVAYKGMRVGVGLKVREELEFSVSDAGSALELFSRLGFSVGVKVSKMRREYRLLGAAVTVDRVDGLGDFVEIEAPEEVREEGRPGLIEMVAEMLGISRESFMTESYVELLESRNSERKDSR